MSTATVAIIVRTVGHRHLGRALASLRAQTYAKLGSLEFAKKVLKDAKVAVSPGIGFGDYGDDYVRIALIENEARSRQAVRGIKEMFRKDGLL